MRLEGIGMGDQSQFALRFISGKYQGGEFLLKMGREIVIGRASDLDMVLVEDMVSRKHAKISTQGDQIVIQDLGSTNGTFVNGEKIKRSRLREGDRILIGTSIVKLVTVDENRPESSFTPTTDFPAGAQPREPEIKRPGAGATRAMAGTIDEIPLPDLLQLLSTSRKSGVLEIHSESRLGRIFMREGQIYFATIDDNLAMPAQKAVYRMLVWQTGAFELRPAESRTFEGELSEPTEGLLMEAMRQLDEINRLREELPAPGAPLQLARPLPKRLRELSPEQLDMLQLVHEHGSFSRVLDHTSSTDLETYTALAELFKAKWITAEEEAAPDAPTS